MNQPISRREFLASTNAALAPGAVRINAQTTRTPSARNL